VKHSTSPFKYPRYELWKPPEESDTSSDATPTKTSKVKVMKSGKAKRKQEAATSSAKIKKSAPYNRRDF
jgi:hypothetical protein